MYPLILISFIFFSFFPTTTIDCTTGFTCSNCPSVAKPECTWCIYENKCGTASPSICSAGFDEMNLVGSVSMCPGLTSLSPPNAIDSGGSTITVAGTYFSPNVSLSCLFGYVSLKGFHPYHHHLNGNR